MWRDLRIRNISTIIIQTTEELVMLEKRKKGCFIEKQLIRTNYRPCQRLERFIESGFIRITQEMVLFRFIIPLKFWNSSQTWRQVSKPANFCSTKTKKETLRNLQHKQDIKDSWKTLNKNYSLTIENFNQVKEEIPDSVETTDQALLLDM